VTGAGRFAIRTASPTGTALQLVDMLTGPSELAGAAGIADGRIDQLLDAGIYKLRLFGAAKAQGETRLSVIPFREPGPPEPAPRPGAVATGEPARLRPRRRRGRQSSNGASRGTRDERVAALSGPRDRQGPGQDDEALPFRRRPRRLAKLKTLTKASKCDLGHTARTLSRPI
jgi:hypothetical protein